MSEVLKPKVSVVVPVYNVEKYVEKCLNSLVNQTFKDIEIIVVNDGSKDNSLEVVKKFENDTRVKIISQENKGLSGARNTGIDNASGDYIAFLDSDDWVDYDFIEKLYDAIIRNDCDIAAATIIRKREKTQKYRVHYTKEEVFETLEEKLKACRIPVCCYVWNKLYKADLVKNYRFFEGVNFEDVLWTPEILKRANKLVVVPNINHYYRVNNQSIVKKIQTPKKQLDAYNAKKYVVNFMEENGVKLSKKDKTYTSLYQL